MKLATKVMASGLLLGACSVATAVPVVTVGGAGDLGSAQTAEANFLATLGGVSLHEDFESYTAATDVNGQTTDPFDAVGATFLTAAGDLGSGGACDNSGFQCSGGLAILNSTESPYNGRFSVPVGTNNWLDSMDAKKMSITADAGYNAMGFYMTDPNDSGGRFEIGGVSFDFESLFGNTALPNGQVYYISIFDTDVATLGEVSILSNASGDGYGIDKLTVGRVPEPGTLALLGLGLAGLGLARRRKQA
jgi:hypothetical protein